MSRLGATPSRRAEVCAIASDVLASHTSSSCEQTLDVDDDVLASAKEIARRERKTAGRVLSELARMSLTVGVAGAIAPALQQTGAFGFKPFASRGAVVTDKRIRELRHEGDE